MGIGDPGILSVGQNLEPTVMDMMKQLIDEDSAIVSVYYGADMKEEDATHWEARSKRHSRMSRSRFTMADSRSTIM